MKMIYYRIISFTCRWPGLDVSCTVDHYILGVPFLGCTQTIPEMKETSVNQQYSADILLPFLTGLLQLCLCSAQQFQHTFKTNAKEKMFGHLFLFLRKLSLFIDNGSTAQEPHLQVHTGHRMGNSCIKAH